MRNKLLRMAQRDLNKRSENLQRKLRNTRNWPQHRDKVAEVFRRFDAQSRTIDWPRYYVSVSAGRPTRAGELGVFHDGEDSTTLAVLDQLTPRSRLTVSEDGTRTLFRERERGAQLVVYYGEHNGFVQVFFAPPTLWEEGQPESSSAPHREILVDYLDNMDDLTPDYVLKQLAKFLVFSRVESALDRASWLDRMRVRWWRFVDVRNRQRVGGPVHELLTPWEKLVLAALFGVAVYVAGVVTSDTALKLWEALNSIP